MRGQGQKLERALWIAYRTLFERARMLERLAAGDRQRGASTTASQYEARSKELVAHASAVLQALSAIDVPGYGAGQDDDSTRDETA
jgi:hypothetical protein